MKRKIIKQGPSTLMVSLPSKWIKKLGLIKGDEIEVTELDRKLLISPDKEKAIGEYRIKIPNPEFFLKRFVHVPYNMGYDSIRIDYENRDVADLVQEQLKFLMGFEMLKETDSYCIIQNVTKGIEEEFENIFQREIFVLIDFYEELVKFMKDKDLEGIKKILQKDFQITRYHLFSKRMLNKVGYKDEKKVCSIYSINVLIELVSDHLRDICNVIVEKGFPDKAVVGIAEKGLRQARLFSEIFQKFDINKIIEMRDLRVECFKSIEGADFGKNPEIIAWHIRTIIDLIHHMSEQFIYESRG
jgi:phosphate uptake regulator